MPLFRRRKRDVVDPEERSPQLGLKYKDLQLLGLMMEDGADLDQPRAERAHAVLAPEFVRESTDFFEALAARYAGEYDGWEASV